MSNASEKYFVEQQHRSSNLTSYRVYPFPSKLEEIAYPLDIKGCPIAPELLVAHSRSHEFEMPSCFHGFESRAVISREDRIFLVCGAMEVDTYKLLFQGFNVRCARYCLRLGPGGSPVSLGSVTSSDSLPSLMSISDSEEEWTTNASSGAFRQFGDGVRQDDDCASEVYSSSSSAMSTTDSLFIDLSASEDGGPYRDAWFLKKDIGSGHDAGGLGGDTNHGYHRLDRSSGRSDVTEVVNGWVSIKDGALFRPLQSSFDPIGDCLTSFSPSRCGEEEQAIVKGLLDEDVYPLLARPDGLSSITSCIDPVTQDFDNDLFLSQIIKDSHKTNISY